MTILIGTVKSDEEDEEALLSDELIINFIYYKVRKKNEQISFPLSQAESTGRSPGTHLPKYIIKQFLADVCQVLFLIFLLEEYFTKRVPVFTSEHPLGVLGHARGVLGAR